MDPLRPLRSPSERLDPFPRGLTPERSSRRIAVPDRVLGVAPGAARSPCSAPPPRELAQSIPLTPIGRGKLQMWRRPAAAAPQTSGETEPSTATREDRPHPCTSTTRPVAKRPRGFISGYRPRGANVDLLAAVQSVLAEYQDQLPLTIEQVFYRLVGKYDYEKTEAAYKRLCDLIANARRGGLIPFDHIRDDGPAVVAPQLWSSGDDWLTAIKRSADHIRLSPWNLQPRYVEVICEAGGMVPMLASVADPYGITVRSGGGFDSITAKHELAQYYARQNVPVTVLHVGDRDPSGEALWTNLSEDVGAFCQSLGADFSVQRWRSPGSSRRSTCQRLSRRRPTSVRSGTREIRPFRLKRCHPTSFRTSFAMPSRLTSIWICWRRHDG